MGKFYFNGFYPFFFVFSAAIDYRTSTKELLTGIFTENTENTEISYETILPSPPPSTQHEPHFLFFIGVEYYGEGVLNSSVLKGVVSLVALEVYSGLHLFLFLRKGEVSSPASAGVPVFQGNSMVVATYACTTPR